MKKSSVWLLTANGPGTLGGPMGSEHIGSVLFSKAFTDVKKAKAYAQSHVDKFNKKYKDKDRQVLDWYKHSTGGYGSDALWILFDIDKKEVA